MNYLGLVHLLFSPGGQWGSGGEWEPAVHRHDGENKPGGEESQQVQAGNWTENKGLNSSNLVPIFF